MTLRWTVFSTISLAILLTSLTAPAVAQQTPQESLKTLEAAEGLEVQLWAGEPMVRNPTAMDIDSRGRVWIAEGLNYRMKQRRFEGMDRIPGADRIRILEDTNGDGQADRVTDFADNIFPVPLGLAIEEIWRDGKQTGTRIYVGNSPDLLVLEDTDGDDVADKRFALLTGFRGIDSDHGLHGMTFGPDGRLYFTVGDARYGADRVQMREPTFDVTDRSRRRVSANNFGTTLRVNRDGTQLEVLSSGHRNNYETAVDSFGNVFGSDNDDDGNRGSRMYWVMDGGRYGYQHPESSRHWAEELPGIIPKLVGTGNGAPCGLIVYEDGRLPDRYQNSVLQIDSGTRQVNVHRLTRHGSAFRSDYEVLLRGRDDWFRPVDLSVAPDGSVFVCDWYDAGVGGNRFSDQTTGRIYRLSKQGASPPQAIVNTDSPIEGLKSPNAATRMKAFNQLQADEVTARSELLAMFASQEPRHRARALHALAALPDSGRKDVVSALQDPHPRIRETALQILARDLAAEFLVSTSTSPSRSPAEDVLDIILTLAEDPDPGVRRCLLTAIRNVPTDRIGEALRQLVRSWDGTDRFYLEAIRAAVVHRESEFLQQLFAELTESALSSGWDNAAVALPPFYPTATNDSFPRPSDKWSPSNPASNIMGIAWALGRPESLPAIQRLLHNNTSETVEDAAIIALSAISDPAAGYLLLKRFDNDSLRPEHRRRILQILARNLPRNWQTLTASPALHDAVRSALNAPNLNLDAIDMIAAAGLKDHSTTLMSLANDSSEESHSRAAAIAALGRLGVTEVESLSNRLLQEVSRNSPDEPLGIAALEALFAMSGSRDMIARVSDQNLPGSLRRRALQLAATDLEGVTALLKLYDDQQLPADLISEFTFLARNHSDRRIRQLATKELPETSADSRKIFDAETVLALQGDMDRGKDIFQNHREAACSKCHRTTGEGNLVGPDLASVGRKYGAKELLYHIQYPSAAINYNFVASVIALEDGRVLTGLVLDRNDGLVTLGLSTGEKVSIPQQQIEEERTQSTSVMPEGLLSTLEAQQVADLLEYLISLQR